MDDKNPGRALVQKRWQRPDVVQARFDKLVEYVDRQLASLPPLTPEQRSRLVAIIRPREWE